MANIKGVQRAAKRIRDLLRQGQAVKADQECDGALARFRGEPVLLSLKAIATEQRSGAEAALPLHDQAAVAAPANPEIIEAYALCLDRAMQGQRACGVRFSLLERGIHHTPSLIQLSWRLMEVNGTLSTSDRTYTPRDFYLLAMAAHDDPVEIAQSLGMMLSKSKRLPEAVPILREAMAFDPANADAWRVYFTVGGGRRTPAKVALERAIVVNGDPRSRMIHALRLDGVQPSRAVMLEERARVERELDALLADRHFRLPIVDIETESPYSMFFFAYHGEDDRPLMEKIAATFAKGEPALQWVAPHADRPRTPGRPLRVGIVGSFSILSIQLQIVHLIAGLAAKNYEVNLYSIDRVNGENTYFIADKPVTVLPYHIRKSREIIASDENDIIFYTDLFMNTFYYFIAFSRLGRVQMIWPGHPVTSGLSSIDYALSSVPNERADADVDYTEKLIRLPTLLAIYPRVDPEYDAVSLDEFGVPEGVGVYMCAQTLYKMHPDFDEILRRVLLADPDGVLLLFENAMPEHTKSIGPRIDALQAEFGARVRMIPRQPLPRYLGLLRHVDVLLDTYHFSGGNTSYQAFQMGVPVVTRPSLYNRGRGTLGLYRVMEFEDLVADSDEAYVALAVRVATDPDFRNYCRAMITERHPRLFDRFDVVDDFIAAFEQGVAEKEAALAARARPRRKVS